MMPGLSAGLLSFVPGLVAALPVAIVVDRVGQVEVVGTAATGSIALLSQLASGTRVRLGPSASLKLLYLANGEEVAVLGPGLAEVGPSDVAAREGATLQRRAPPAGERMHLKVGAVAMGGVVMRGAVRARYPIGALTERPTGLVWEGLLSDSLYDVQIFDAGVRVFSGQARGLRLAFPDELELVPGRRYEWTVAIGSDANAPGTTRANFELAPTGLRDEAKRLRPQESAPFSDYVKFALWLEQVGAFGEAAQSWKRLSDQRPDDDALYARAHR